ncbi:MAG: T9SS type A sorting domain-containing protein [Bacteroidetes bacterium]|nr:T9SS type A sorting domain-containing protein [Bacteroidota bacterium]
MKKIILTIIVCLVILKTGQAQSWQLQQQRNNLELSDLHFLDSSNGFIFGDSAIGGALITGVVLKTFDGGTTWNTYTLGNSNYRTTKACVLNANELFSAGRNGGGNDGLFIKSVDGGATWTNPTTFPERLFNVYFINSSTGWVMGKNGLLSKTTDGGINWVSQNVTGEDMFCMKFFNNGTTGILGCGGGELYRTTDGGNSWNAIASNVPDGLLGVDVKGGDAWFCGEAGTIIYSNDYGQTWSTQSSSLPIDFGSVSFADNTHGWMGGMAGTINSTIDGGSLWQSQPSGSSVDISGLSIPDINHGWYCNTDGEIYSFNTATTVSDLTTENPEVIFYPNPSHDFLFLTNNRNQEINVSLINENGQTVKTFDMEACKKTQLDISKLSPGTYQLISVSKSGNRGTVQASVIKL